MAEYNIKVNGLPIVINSDVNTIRTIDILDEAKKIDAFPRESTDYFLQGEHGQYYSFDSVNLRTEEHFITIPFGPANNA